MTRYSINRKLGRENMDERAVNVVGVGGSMAETSRIAGALKIVLKGVQEAGANTAAFEIANLDLPMYAPGDAAPTPAALRLADAVYLADGVVWSSPMYHGTVGGSFKNALDWLQLLSDRDPPYLTNKVVGLVSTTGGVQGLRQSQRFWKSPLNPAPLRIMESPPLLPRLASLAASPAATPNFLSYNATSASKQ